MRVLVVEDDDAIRHAISILLSDEGYRVTGAADGREALEALEDGDPPAVILLDMTMPGMNGLEFRAEQLRHDDLARIPVVLCTADDRAREKARDLGVVETLPKPFEPETLLAIVARYASRPGEPRHS